MISPDWGVDPSMSCKRIRASRGVNNSEWSAKRDLSIKLSEAPESTRALRSCGTRSGIKIVMTRDQEKAEQDAEM